MRRSRSTHRDRSIDDSCLTPLIDVTFLLIVFFVVVANLTSAERMPMPLSRVREAQTVPDRLQRRLVINVVPDAQRAGVGGDYLVGVRAFDATPEAMERLTAMLERHHRDQPNDAAVVRAARSEAYERVLPILDACRLAGLTDVRLVTEDRDG